MRYCCLFFKSKNLVYKFTVFFSKYYSGNDSAVLSLQCSGPKQISIRDQNIMCPPTFLMSGKYPHVPNISINAVKR